MRNRLIGLALLCVSLVLAQHSAVAFKLGSGKGQNSSANVAVPGGRSQLDVAYGNDPAQRMDVYYPERTTDAPVIMMVHGGGWVIGDKQSSGVVSNKVAHWVPQGFVVISVGYRLAPAANALEQARDVAKALAFAQSKAKTWGADPSKFILMGHSAGGHLVSLLASSPTLVSAAGAQPWLGTISLDSAALDVVARMKGVHQSFFDQAFGKDPKAWSAASPIECLSAAPKPMLLVCSSLRKDSCPQCDAFTIKARKFGGRVIVYPVSMSHRDINVKLGTPGAYTDKIDGFINSLVMSSN